MTIAILIFFVILFVLMCILRMARIGALVAFLIAGVISGPYVLNLFQLSETWTFLGDLGILFLWFNLGLEINMRRLWDMRRTIFGFGAAQVLMVAFMMFPILTGLTTWSMLGCIMVALLFAMSSTSEDIQLLTDRNQLNTNMGRQTFSILLFQDLLSIPLLAMLPVFAGKSFNLGATAIDILVLSVALIVGVVVIGRFVLNPLMRLVARLKSREAFVLAVMLNIIVWACVMNLIGLPVGLCRNITVFDVIYGVLFHIIGHGIEFAILGPVLVCCFSRRCRTVDYKISGDIYCCTCASCSHPRFCYDCINIGPGWRIRVVNVANYEGRWH